MRFSRTSHRSDGRTSCLPASTGGENSAPKPLAYYFAPSRKRPQEAWTDEITFTLEPSESTEIKATMEADATLNYAWTSTGGRVNFDLHAHADGENVTYEKGRGQTSGEGSFETPFAGDHGWFWRNRDDEAVTVTLQLRGAYSEIVRSE